MKKIKELLFKQHSPSYLALLTIAVLAGAMIGSTLLFLIGWLPRVIMDPSEIMTFGAIGWFLAFGCFFGAPISILAGIFSVLFLYIKKSLSAFDAGLIGGMCTMVLASRFFNRLHDEQDYQNIFDINAGSLVLFGFGFLTAVLTYLFAVNYCRDELFSQ